MKKKKNKPQYIEYEDGTRILLTEDDVPELTAEFFKNARPLRDSFPELAAYSERMKKRMKLKRGRPKKAAPKRLQSFKLSPDVIDAIRGSGPGYNRRVESVLRRAIEEGWL